MGALGCVAEQPVFATDDEGADGTFGWVVVDRQVAAFQVADQPGPVVGQVADSLTQRTLRCDVRLCLVQPAFQLLHRALDTLRHRESPSLFTISAITCSISRQSLDMAPPARSTSHEEAASTRRATLPRINRDTAFFP